MIVRHCCSIKLSIQQHHINEMVITFHICFPFHCDRKASFHLYHKFLISKSNIIVRETDSGIIMGPLGIWRNIVIQMKIVFILLLNPMFKQGDDCAFKVTSPWYNFYLDNLFNPFPSFHCTFFTLPPCRREPRTIMPAEIVTLPVISNKIPAPLTGKEFLTSSHYKIGNDRRLSRSATKRSTFKKDYVAHRFYGRGDPAEPPAPASVMHKDLVAKSADTTETHACYKVWWAC